MQLSGAVFYKEFILKNFADSLENKDTGVFKVFSKNFNNTLLKEQPWLLLFIEAFEWVVFP